MLSDAFAQLGADSIQWTVIVTILALGVLDFVFGVLRAVANKTGPAFDISLLDVWVRTQLAGRIVPIILVLLFSALAPSVQIAGFTFSPLAIAANTAAGAYALTTSKSIIDSLNTGTTDRLPEA